MIIIELLLVFIAGFFIYLWSKRRSKRKLNIYLLEHYMKIDNPVPLCGTPDVVWIDHNGILVVGDYKSRFNNQVYDSDVIQLSVYRLLLKQSINKKVAKFGFIHFKDGRKVKVNLLNTKVVIKLFHRYQEIIDGTTKACYTKSKKYCQSCRYVRICNK